MNVRKHLAYNTDCSIVYYAFVIFELKDTSEGSLWPALSSLREALFTSGSAKLDHVRSSVRPFVRPFVRIIIDFYQEDMKGAETLLGTGSLNYGF